MPGPFERIACFIDQDESSEMVLADDNFVSITAAVEEGRVTFDNIRKVTFFLVSTGAAEITAILVAVWLQWPLILLPAQLLWLNLVTNGVQDVALAFEPAERGVLRRPPRTPGGGVLDCLMWERVVLAGLVMVATEEARAWIPLGDSLRTLLVGGVADDGGDLAQAGLSTGLEAPFAGDQLEAVAVGVRVVDGDVEHTDVDLVAQLVPVDRFGYEVGQLVGRHRRRGRGVVARPRVGGSAGRVGHRRRGGRVGDRRRRLVGRARRGGDRGRHRRGD